ncbi:hypothetical protein IK112_03460 [Candidatus Saccharibacteria bacterium]|nr:hypothetical protein [Candidatus Saccharibacteria bacterium]
MNSIKNKKVIIITIITIIVAIVIFFIAASNIVVDECASPCRHTDAEICITVCDKVTLLDWILGNGS